MLIFSSEEAWSSAMPSLDLPHKKVYHGFMRDAKAKNIPWNQ